MSSGWPTSSSWIQAVGRVVGLAHQVPTGDRQHRRQVPGHQQASHPRRPGDVLLERFQVAGAGRGMGETLTGLQRPVLQEVGSARNSARILSGETTGWTYSGRNCSGSPSSGTVDRGALGGGGVGREVVAEVDRRGVVAVELRMGDMLQPEPQGAGGAAVEDDAVDRGAAAAEAFGELADVDPPCGRPGRSAASAAASAGRCDRRTAGRPGAAGRVFPGSAAPSRPPGRCGGRGGRRPG